MNSAAPEVSIVVNFFNPKGDARIRAMTEFALRCYRAFTKLPHELLLIDGHAEPDPKLQTVCEELGYRYVNAGRRLSFAEGYNTGLRLAQTPWVVTAANDIFVVAGWLELLLEAAKSTGAWMASPYLSICDYYGQQLTHVLSKRTYQPNFLTLNLNLISRRCLDTVGVLDERFSGCFNDVDYALRIRAQGGTVILTDCGEITHLGSATIEKSGLLAMYARDLALFEQKWPGAWDPASYRLRAQKGWLRFFFGFERWLPLRWRQKYRRSVSRLEPLLAPALTRPPPSS